MKYVRRFDEMIGATMANISGDAGDEEMVFTAVDGTRFRFYHEPDCCETVRIEDVCGDISWLVGYPLSEAEETVSERQEKGDYESSTWTFYRFSTVRGTVTVRWLGESNGYYSESVDYQLIPSGKEASTGEAQ